MTDPWNAVPADQPDDLASWGIFGRLPSSGPFRSLRHRAYLALWSTHLVTQIGFWVSNVTLQWLVARLTGSDSFMLGLLFFLNLIPILIWVPYAGVVADRFERRRVVVATQIGIAMLATFMIIVLTVFGPEVSLVPIFVFAFALGTALAINAPANTAILVNAVPAKDVSSAVGLQSVGLNLSRVAGPALATPLLLSWGARPAFGIFAATSVFTAAIVRRLRIRPVELIDASEGTFRRIIEGLHHSRERHPARPALGLVAVTAMFASSHVSLMPAFAYRVFDRGDVGFTTLLVVTGVGAAAGALATSARDNPPSLRILGVQLLLMCIALTGFANSPSYLIAVFLTPVVAFLNFSIMTNLNTTLQYVVAENNRGRIMSLYLLCYAGLLPIGALVLGAIGDFLGVSLAVTMFAGIAATVGVGYIFWGPSEAPLMAGD